MIVLSDSAVANLQGAIDRPDAGERYVVYEQLGQGGMGAVYRAFDSILERDVALKVLATDAESAGFSERLEREAKVLARLEHPGIVAVHDAGVLDDGRPFYVMRLVNGERYDAYAARAARGDLLRAFVRICDAVGYAHAQGVIHRDITPGNVMVGEFGDVLVLDWGVGVIGTPGFMAPEQDPSSKYEVDARADVHGLGATLRYALIASKAEVPRPLDAILVRATATHPGDRYPSVEELAAEVRRFMDGERVNAYRESLLEKAMRFYRRNKPLILLLLAYAVMRIVILVWRGV